jgi:iron complex transport system ATP-binding protein
MTQCAGLEAIGVSIGYEKKIIISDLNLDIDRYGITTFLGPNGCGKSTILKAVTRILKCGGLILIEGCDLHTLRTKEVARHLAFLPQQRAATPDITVEEFVACGRIPYQDFFQRETQGDKEIIRWAMTETSVWDMRGRSVSTLSGGEKQRVCVAAALAQKPQMLFLDEPTTYLDIHHQFELLALLRRLNREAGIGIVLVLHDIAQAFEISTEIVAIKDGKVYARGTPREVVTPRMLRDVYNVSGRVVALEDRVYPIIAYDGLISTDEMRCAEL